MGKRKRTAPLASEEARQQARAEGLTLRKADSKTGYFGVYLTNPGTYAAKVSRGGKLAHLGCFATAEEAALCIARSPEGQEAAKRAAAATPLTSEEAQQQAEAEGLTLRVADNKAGYYGVSHLPGHPKPYAAHVSRGGKQVHLGSFATAEEAALCIARSPAAQEAPAAKKAPAAKVAADQAKAEKAAADKAAREARWVAEKAAREARRVAADQARRAAADQAEAEKAAAVATTEGQAAALLAVAKQAAALLKRKRLATSKKEARQQAEAEHFFRQCWR